MESTKYVGLDVHKEATTVAVMNSAGKLIMESIIETKAITILHFILGHNSSMKFFLHTIRVNWSCQNVYRQPSKCRALPVHLFAPGRLAVDTTGQED